MKSVVCFGEALIDFLNTSEQDDGPLSLKNYRQYPGGAPANAAVAIAKLGGEAYFAGQVGADNFGDFLNSTLNTYNVDTRFLAQHKTAKTALAFVMLDSDGDRSFAFHRHQTADVLFNVEQVEDSWFEPQVIFHFCSNTLTDNHIANTTDFAVQKAKHHQALISFDVNLRHNLWPQGQADIALVNQFVFNADVIKFSRDELEYLALGNVTSYIAKCIKKGVSLLVITDGENDIEYFTVQGKQLISAPKVQAIDTTAGGDAFSGALLFALSQFPQAKLALNSMSILGELIRFAAHCGAYTVGKLGAFPALPQFNDVQNLWPTDLIPEQEADLVSELSNKITV